MKKYKIRVTEVEEYCDEIEVTAKSKKEALKLVTEQLVEDPLSQRKNTYNGCTQEMEFL